MDVLAAPASVPRSRDARPTRSTRRRRLAGAVLAALAVAVAPLALADGPAPVAPSPAPSFADDPAADRSLTPAPARAAKSKSAAASPGASADPFAEGDPFADGPAAPGHAGGAVAAAPELLLFKDIPIVVAAGKRAQTQRQAAASVSIVNADDIDLFGYRSLADVLRGQRSFYLQSDGLNFFGGVRGFMRPGEWNARVMVLVDGRPTREMVYNQTHLDQDFGVPMEAVKRVEIVRGPGSSLYGGNAVLAVINVVTKDASDANGGSGKAGGVVKVGGGNKETGRAAGVVAQKFGDWEVLAAGSGLSTAGDKDVRYDGVHDADRNFGRISDNDHEDAMSAFFKARNGDFTIELDLEKRKKGNRAASYLSSFFDPGRMIEDRINFTLKYDHTIDPTHSLHAMAYLGYYGYDQQYGYTDPTIGPYQYRTRSENTWGGAEVHYDWQVTDAVHLTLGADGTQTIAARQTDDSGLDGRVLDSDNGANAWGLFAEAEWKVNSWLTLVGGLRLDKVERQPLLLNPRAAVLLSPTKDDTVKLLYGRSFRTPNLYELFYVSPGSNTPNRALRPELCDTYEAVWERELGGGWRSTVDYYYWQFNHALGNAAADDGSLMFVNRGKLYAQGIEVELAKRWENGASFRVYGTYGRATAAGGEHLANSPDWIVGTSVAFPVFGKRTFLAIEPQIVGPMKNDLGERTDVAYLTNVVLTSRDLIKGAEVQLGAYNLFAKDTRQPRGDGFYQSQSTLNYPEPLIMLSISYRF